MQDRVRGMRVVALMVGVGCLVSSLARAENVRFYELEGFGHFLDGNPVSTAVTEEGAIALPPPSRDWFSDPAAVFSAAAAYGDEVLVARVEDAQVVAIDRAGKSRAVFKAQETLVTALLTVGEDVFVAAGAPAKIYRVGKNGKSELYYTLDAEYVWGLAKGTDDSIYAVTGDPGTVVRIDKKSSGKVVFAPEQEHLRSVWVDKSLGVFVGGGSRGVVYRAQNGKDFKALYDTGHPEVTYIVTQGAYVYAAGVSGAQELASETASKGEKGGKAASVRSQLVRISMDGSSEVLAGSSDEAIFSLAIDDKGQVLVATGATGREDPRGRIYSIDPTKRMISMLLQSPSKRITQLVNLKGSIAAVSAAGGRITNITPGYNDKGQFLTLPFDTGINSRFGVLQLYGNWPKGTSVSAAVRTGQTSEPDDSWSDWSSEINAPGNARPQVPNGRYAQVRMTLKGDGKTTPTVHRVRLAYLRQNLPPFVREVTALKKGLALYPIPQESQKSKTINLSDKGTADERRDDDERGGMGRARQVEESGALTLRWVADDPNGDQLSYDLMYRPSGERDWQKLRGGLAQPFFTLNSSQLPDGHYQFKVQASDAPSNAEGQERQDSRESRDVLVDNTPPKIDALKVDVSGKRVTVRGVFADQVGPLLSASYSLDARDPKPILPDDGVLDGPGESFTLRLGDLAEGRHIVTVRVRDEADNEAVAETAFTIK